MNQDSERKTAHDDTAITTFGGESLRRVAGGFAVRTGLRAGRVKTSDKQQQAVLDFIKG